VPGSRVEFKDNLPRVIERIPGRTDHLKTMLAQLAARYAQAGAPTAEQDPRTIPGEPGDLKKSIKAGKMRKDGVESIGVLLAWYWFFVEYGTRFQSPHPFVRPAVEVARKEIHRTAKVAYTDL
jgi:HK97 gp10 family phage protein